MSAEQSVFLLFSTQTDLFRQFLLAIIIAVIGIVLYLESKSSQKLSQKTLERFSELPALPLVGPFYSLYKHRNDLEGLGKTWSNIYGSCWRTKALGANVLFIHDPALLKPLLLSTDYAHLEKDSYAYPLLAVGPAIEGLLGLHGKDWARHRKCLNPLFTYEALKRYVKIIQKHGEQLVLELKENNEKQYTTDMTTTEIPYYRSQIHLTTMDVITEIVTGVSFKTVLGQDGGMKLYDDMEAVKNILETQIVSKPWTLIPIVGRFFPWRKRLEKHVQDLKTAILKVRECHVPQPDSKFALDLMINAKWSDSEILAEIFTFIIGGHETTSVSLALLLWMLALEQEHQAICCEEVDEVFDMLENTGQELTLECLSGMKHLERCIKENIRLFPSATFGTSRELKSPLQLDQDMILPPGTVITFFPYLLHRNPKIYPDPEKFDPDRFLPDNVRDRDTFAYLPFSAGPRMCIGWKMALTELTVLSALILRNFHLVTTDKREDIKIKCSLSLYPSKQPNIIFQRRR